MEGSQVVEAAVIDVPANVAVPEVGAEMPVINKERWEELRRMHADGLSFPRNFVFQEVGYNLN